MIAARSGSFREVLLDDACTESDRRHRDGDAEGVSGRPADTPNAPARWGMILRFISANGAG